MNFLLFLLFLHSAEPDVGYADGRPFYVTLVDIPGRDIEGCQLRLQVDAAAAWLDLVEAAARDGIELRPTYAYRTQKQQKGIKRRNGRLAAKPGFSSHQAGLSVDVGGVRRNKQMRKWLRANAPKFCFQHDVPRESWHITFNAACYQSKKL